MDSKYRIKTYDSIYSISSIAVFIVVGFVVAIFIFQVNPLAIKIMFGLDLIAIPLFFIIYRGEIEFTLTDDKIYIRWIRKPFLKKVTNKTIYNKNILKFCSDRDSIMNHQSHIMCQIVQTDENFVFYLADTVKRQQELAKLKTGFRKLAQIENDKRTGDSKIQLKLNY